MRAAAAAAAGAAGAAGAAAAGAGAAAAGAGAAAAAASSQPSSLACRMPMRNTRIHSRSSSPGGRGCQNPDQDFGTKTWFIFESKNKNSAKFTGRLGETGMNSDGIRGWM